MTEGRGGMSGVQRKKEVSSKHSVHGLVLTRGCVDRHAELKRLVKRRRQ